jgi:hypothetical protein
VSPAFELFPSILSTYTCANQSGNRSWPATLYVNAKLSTLGSLPRSLQALPALDPQKAVSHTARIKVASGDCPLRVDALRDGTLAWTCARARSVEGGDGGAVGRA